MRPMSWITPSQVVFFYDERAHRLGKIAISDSIFIRQCGDMLVFFVDQQTICALTDCGAYVFHRWFHKKRGFYTNNFKPFRKYLMNNPNITLSQAIRLAEKYEMEFSADRRLVSRLLSNDLKIVAKKKGKK